MGFRRESRRSGPPRGPRHGAAWPVTLLSPTHAREGRG